MSITETTRAMWAQIALNLIPAISQARKLVTDLEAARAAALAKAGIAE